MIKLSPHFTLRELTHSALAVRHGIDNLPEPSDIVRLKRLSMEILEPVRSHYGIPFSPSSGYRSPAVNKLAGSGSTSQHVKGEAVDFEVPGIANASLAQWIKDNLIFDQLILEFHSPAVPYSGWAHVSLIDGNNRHQSLIFDGKRYREF